MSEDYDMGIELGTGSDLPGIDRVPQTDEEAIQALALCCTHELMKKSVTLLYRSYRGLGMNTLDAYQRVLTEWADIILGKKAGQT